MPRKIAYAITAVNLLFQLVYMTLGRFTPGELGGLQYIFHLFRAEYMISQACSPLRRWASLRCV